MKKTRYYYIYRVSLLTKEISILDKTGGYWDSRYQMAEYLRKSRKNNEAIIVITKEKYRREYLIQKDKNAYMLRW